MHHLASLLNITRGKTTSTGGSVDTPVTTEDVTLLCSGIIHHLAHRPFQFLLLLTYKEADQTSVFASWIILPKEKLRKEIFPNGVKLRVLRFVLFHIDGMLL